MENEIIKILGIDDNKDNLVILKALILEIFPTAQLFTALSGEEGLKLAAEENLDLILLDIIMPGMSGYEVCKQLKEDQKLSNTPVVFVTSIKDDKDSRVIALDMGAEGFLSKPIDRSELTAMMHAMLKVKKAKLDKLDENKQLEILVEERTKELIASKDYLNKIINTIASPIFVKDDKHKFCLVNDAFCSLVGSPAEKLIGTSDYEHFLDNQLDTFIAKDLEVLNSGKENINEEFITDAKGEIRTIVTRKTLYTDPSGNKFLVGIINDITERKQAEEKIKESEERFKTLIENSSDVISILDDKGIITYESPSHEKVLGYE
ncbi:MAG: PAS domain S-box protein, partial [Candidatus Delongbacteria bacterium]|nr:PAS domain S-box protein [Candidatus Delongbacteria bacterium]